jgi:hypothetical protein
MDIGPIGVLNMLAVTTLSWCCFGMVALTTMSWCFGHMLAVTTLS